ncbi:MAG: HDOD domain-containing protein [Ideonella sp.]|nr:HDOD domain-containing protein [Ideonella sp.]
MNPVPPASPAPRYPHDLAGWVRYFRLVELPVLRRTAASLEDFRDMEDDVDARMIADVISADPLMTLKLLAYTATLHRERRTTDVETAREAVVLIGITPFFRTFGPQPTIEEHLHGQTQARAGLTAVLRRARRAARFAMAFAAHRGDHDAPVIYEAALLHDFAEMLLWLHAPESALEIQRRQHLDPTLRSNTVQRELLGTTLAEIQHAMMVAWRLPELLIRITDDSHVEASQVRNVLLAIRIARHTAQGWENPAIPDDVADISRLLNLSAEPTLKLLHDIER